MKARSGWTLVEMLMVVITLGILGMAVIPRLIDTRKDAYADVMRADLNNLAAAMEHHIAVNGSYPNPTLASPADSLLPGATGTGRLVGYSPDSSVTVTYIYKAADAYAAIATHGALPGKWCGIYVGNIPAIATYNPNYVTNPTSNPEIRCPMP